MNFEVADALDNWFREPGAYVLVDGQYGSTGKGVISAAMAECFSSRVEIVTSNAAPNSGHTSYYKDEKIVLKQLPTFSVIANKKANDGSEAPVPLTYLNAGAVIDPDILDREAKAHGMIAWIHPHAAVIDADMKAEDVKNVKGIASTGQGVGPAIQRKLSRTSSGVMSPGSMKGTLPDLTDKVVFIEVSQGYSLGINSGFYPHVTTRECTVGQAMSDANMHPSLFRKSIMCVRTFPIRVGSTENSSGPCYSDQEEISWEDIEQAPETTTVTGRVRRVFTWSDQQFREALQANRPDAIFLNFVNYLDKDGVEAFVEDRVIDVYRQVMGKWPETVLLGYGPKSSDIKVWEV